MKTQTPTEIKTEQTQKVFIETNNKYAEQSLKKVVLDVEKITLFNKDKTLNLKDGKKVIVESENINQMFDLAKNLNSDVLKYAYGKKIYTKSKRDFNMFQKENQKN